MADRGPAHSPGDVKDRLAALWRDGDFHWVRPGVAELMREHHSARALHLVSTQIRRQAGALRGLRAARVAVLASYSSEFLQDALITAFFLRGIAAEIYQPPFNNFRQEILDPDSGLYRFAPDAAILSALGEHVCPALYERGPTSETPSPAVIAEYESLIDAFRSRSPAPLLVQNLLPPAHPVFGAGDSNVSCGQREEVQRINQRLREICRARAGVYAVDYDALVARHGILAWHDERMRYLAQLPIDRRMFLPLAAEFAKICNALQGGAKKCLVLDLDNTLWGGVVGEDGIDGIKLGAAYPGNAYRAFQLALRALSERGVLLAIASKNNPADVDEVFETHPDMVLKKDDFAAIQIGWRPKSEMVEAIADELSIGLEHIVLMDDNPAECAEVEQALPMVRTLLFPRQPERFAAALAEDGLFDAMHLSTEDRKRAQLYRQRAAAESLRGRAANLEDFYRGLDMAITIEPVSSRNLTRAAQLTQKTNQLNLTTRRYTEADLTERLRDPAWHCWTVAVRDRFGDNGIVGVMLALAAPDRLILDTFLLSCRVIGRTVETAMLAHLCDLARRLGVPLIEATLVSTAKNLPVRSLLPDHDFTQVSEEGRATMWHLDLDTRRISRPAWFRIAAQTVHEPAA